MNELEGFHSVVRRLAAQKGDQYAMGWDCAVNGANLKNCHFRLFSSTAHTKLWEEGKAAGEQFKAQLPHSAGADHAD